VLIEPQLELAGLLRANRSAKVYAVACSSPENAGRALSLHVAGPLSSLDRERMAPGAAPERVIIVPAKTLDSVLDDAGCPARIRFPVDRRRGLRARGAAWLFLQALALRDQRLRAARPTASASPTLGNPAQILCGAAVSLAAQSVAPTAQGAGSMMATLPCVSRRVDRVGRDRSGAAARPRSRRPGRPICQNTFYSSFCYMFLLTLVSPHLAMATAARAALRLAPVSQNAARCRSALML
jgi:hypothetical protein